MFKLNLAVAVGALFASCGIALATDAPINGTVQSRCIIQTDTSGTYANPNAYTLTTSSQPMVVRMQEFVLTYL